MRPVFGRRQRRRRRRCDAVVVAFVTFVKERLDFVEQRLRPQRPDVGLHEDQALVVQRLQVAFLILEKIFDKVEKFKVIRLED